MVSDIKLKCENNEPTTMSNLLRSAQINNPSVVKFTPDNTMPDELFYQSFMAKHLGGKIHITNYCFLKNNVINEPHVLHF